MHATRELLKPQPLHARLLGAPGAHKAPDQTTVAVRGKPLSMILVVRAAAFLGRQRGQRRRV